METQSNEERMAFEFSPGEKTVVLLTSPAKETDEIVLLIHGFMSAKNSETNMALTKNLVKRGVAAIRLDLFGHGESDGPFPQLTLSKCLHQVDGVMDWVRKKGYRRISVVGSSFGGLIGIHTASKNHDLVRLGLRCPVSNYPSIWQDRLSKEGMTRWKDEGVLSFVTEDGKARLEYGYYEDLLRHDTYTAAAQIKTPTLIVHGDADFDVPVDQSYRLFDTLRLANHQKQLVVAPGADHGFSKQEDFDKMIQAIDAWIMPPSEQN
jgi:pimeloyl-ACP methyl ester carboxylesterase